MSDPLDDYFDEENPSLERIEDEIAADDEFFATDQGEAIEAAYEKFEKSILVEQDAP